MHDLTFERLLAKSLAQAQKLPAATAASDGELRLQLISLLANLLREPTANLLREPTANPCWLLLLNRLRVMAQQPNLPAPELRQRLVEELLLAQQAAR